MARRRPAGRLGAFRGAVTKPACGYRGAGAASWFSTLPARRATRRRRGASDSGSAYGIMAPRSGPHRRGVDESDPAQRRVVAARLPSRQPRRHQPVPQARPGPADPRRRPDQPPHQARHAHDGWRRGHPGHAGRLLRRQAGHDERADRVGAAAAVPLRGDGPGRLPRRLHQDRPAAQPRPAEQGEDGRPDRGGTGLRRTGAGPLAQGRERPDPGVTTHFLHPGLRGLRPARGRGDGADLADRHRHQQRREPQRRPRRTRGGRVDDGLRRLHAGEHLAEQPVLRLLQPRRGQQEPVLHGPRPARPGRGRGRAHRGLLRLPVVERLAGRDLHGRHRLAGPRRCRGRAGDPDPHRAAARHPGRAVRDDHVLGDAPGQLVQGDQAAHRHGPTHLPDGAAPAPLRDARLGTGHGHHPLLDHQRHLCGRRPRRLLRRVGLAASDELPSDEPSIARPARLLGGRPGRGRRVRGVRLRRRRQPAAPRRDRHRAGREGRRSRRAGGEGGAARGARCDHPARGGHHVDAAGRRRPAGHLTGLAARRATAGAGPRPGRTDLGRGRAGLAAA